MTYALLFRTHFWDAFTERAFERLRRQAPGADAYIVADETVRPVDCPSELKLPHTVERFNQLGFAIFPQAQTMWYNGDYPLYSAFLDLPYYDYYIMAEYDVVTNAQIDHVIEALENSGADVVTHGLQPANLDWFWTNTANMLYRDVYGSINPFLIISRRALCNLYHARLAHSQWFKAGTLKQWPYCEAFIASELKNGGFKNRELSEFGLLRHFEWWPPQEESFVLNELSDEAFIHPVLAGDAYFKSVTRYDVASGGPVPRTPEAWDRAFLELKESRAEVEAI